jgi:FdhD protein
MAEDDRRPEDIPEDRISIPIIRWSQRGAATEEDLVSVEEPLEIFVDDQPFYLTMRSPGEELFLAAGLCFSEGIIASMDHLSAIGYCKDISRNRINVSLNPARKGAGISKVRQKGSVSYSGCGICGKELVAEIAGATESIERRTTVPFPLLLKLQQALGAGQNAYNATGGTHGAALFTASGETLAHAEDVGRHNALDKAIGKVLFAGTDKEAAIALLSSRLSYEMVQKAARLGIEILAGASAPTSLGVNLAEKVGLTLVGFLRAGRGNIYTCPERILL